MENEEKILENLFRTQRETIKKYPEDTKEKILQKIEDGYRIYTCNYPGVRLVKGSSYWYIERNGKMYEI